MTNETKEKIAYEVIKTLISRFESFPDDSTINRNAPFHEAFLNAFKNKLEEKVSDIPFMISLSSWLHGLNTTLGQQFFENVAHIVSNGTKKEWTNKKEGNLFITKKQKDTINEIITKLSTDEKKPNLEEENSLIFKDDNTQKVKAINFSADIFYEDEDSVTGIELKSVKPNSGEMRGEKQKILEGKVALYYKFKPKKINFFIAFPFDPTSDKDVEYDKDRFLNSIINMKKSFSKEEVLLSAEFWDYISNEKNTMQEILNIINSISTPNFMKNFQFIQDKKNLENRDKYRKILKNWYLYSELKIFDNFYEIRNKIRNDKIFLRIFNKSPFNNKGKYNIDRKIFIDMNI
jgi:hypothetical protein